MNESALPALDVLSYISANMKTSDGVEELQYDLVVFITSHFIYYHSRTAHQSARAVEDILQAWGSTSVQRSSNP